MAVTEVSGGFKCREIGEETCPRPRSAHERRASARARCPTQRLLDIRCVPLGLHLMKDPFDASLGIDDERRAKDPHVLPPEHGLLAPDAVRVGNLVIGVSHEREWQAELLLEFLMRFDAV